MLKGFLKKNLKIFSRDGQPLQQIILELLNALGHKTETQPEPPSPYTKCLNAEHELKFKTKNYST